MNRYEYLSIIVNSIYTFFTLLILCLAYIQYKYSIKVSRIKSSLEFLERESSSQELRQIRIDYANLRATLNKDEIIGLVEKRDEKSNKQREVIFALLNRYEYMAIGIDLRVIDYGTFYRLWKSTTLRDWSNTKEFIQNLRSKSGNNLYMVEFEKLVARIAVDKMNKK